MRQRSIGFLLLPLTLSLAACGGGVRAVATGAGGCDEDSGCPSGDAGHEAAVADAGACGENSFAVVNCNGMFEYCCPAGANCAPPSCLPLVDAGNEGAAADAGGCDEDSGCHRLDAGQGADAADAGPCPGAEYLLIPCCGGINDTSCSNGSGPPAPQPFCTALPAMCDGQPDCIVGECEGSVDQTKRTLQCNCI